jgi:hypothetical protein
MSPWRRPAPAETHQDTPRHNQRLPEYAGR